VPAFTANSIAIAQTCAIPESRSLPRDDLGPRPNGPREFQQNRMIFLRHAAGEKNSNPDLLHAANVENFRI